MIEGGIQRYRRENSIKAEAMREAFRKGQLGDDEMVSRGQQDRQAERDARHDSGRHTWHVCRGVQWSGRDSSGFAPSGGAP